MKFFLLFFSSLLFFQSYAQNKDSIGRGNKKIFVRLYNSQSKKLGKGGLLYGSDSTIEITHNSKRDTFPVQKVFYIKTRRSAGHSILVGATVGTATGVMLIFVSSTSSGDGFSTSRESSNISVGKAAAAPLIGIATGGILAALGKREKFTINGNVEKWNEVRKKLF